MMVTSRPRRRAAEWFDDETFWRELYPYMFAAEKFAAAEEEVEKVLTLAEPPGTDVLDLCCGPGRFAIPLARRGYTVTGVDRTQYLLDKARAKARAAGVKVHWRQRDMRDHRQPEAFDMVLSMFTSLGYFADKADDVTVLANMHASLRPGGCCVIDVMSKERLAQVFASTGSHTFPDGAVLVERREIIDDWTRARNEWILVRNGRAKTFRFALTVYSAQELRDRLEHVGFHDVTFYGTLDGTPYDRTAERLVAVARKARRPES